MHAETESRRVEFGEELLLLAKDVLNDVGGIDSSELLIEAEEGKAELVVVETKLVEDGGVEIAHVDGVLGDVVAKLIRFAVADPAFDTCASHPRGEATWVMIAAVVGGAESSLTVGRATKLTAEDNECVL